MGQSRPNTFPTFHPKAHSRVVNDTVRGGSAWINLHQRRAPGLGPERIRALIQSVPRHGPRITPKSRLANREHIVAGDELMSTRCTKPTDIAAQHTRGPDTLRV